LRDDVRSDIERVADVDLIPGDIPEIRNRLSHGAEDYSWQTLRPAMRTMPATRPAHVLHLLDPPLNRSSTVSANIDRRLLCCLRPFATDASREVSFVIRKAMLQPAGDGSGFDVG
jgi:hypothetical protein